MNSLIESGIVGGIIVLISSVLIFIFKKIKGNKFNTNSYIGLGVVIILLLWGGLKFLQFYTFHNTKTNGQKIVPNIDVSSKKSIDKNSILPTIPTGFTLVNEHVNKLNQECLDKNLDSCVELAGLYYVGKEVTQDYIKAAELYSKACDNGNFEGCFDLGWMYNVSDRGVKQNLAKAFSLYKKACDNGHTGACNNLDLMDTTVKIDFYKKTCDTGLLDSCLKLGYIYGKGTKKTQDFFKAFELYDKVCREGISAGCWNLGYLYEKGQGVKQDYTKAAEEYKKACDNENSAGCLSLGIMFANGEGIEKNNKKALDFFGRACDMKEQLGCDFYAKLKNKLGK